MLLVVACWWPYDGLNLRSLKSVAGLQHRDCSATGGADCGHSGMVVYGVFSEGVLVRWRAPVRSGPAMCYRYPDDYGSDDPALSPLPALDLASVTRRRDQRC